MTESTKKSRRSPKPKADTVIVDAIAPEKTTKSVTSPIDLRIVTKDFVVFLLKAGVTRELNEHLALAAVNAAAEKSIQLQVD